MLRYQRQPWTERELLVRVIMDRTRTVSTVTFSPFLAPIHMTRDTLEDALACDATLADFFSVFLQLPIFPRPMVYNVEILSVEEKDTGHDAHVEPDPVRVMRWVKEARSELFLR